MDSLTSSTTSAKIWARPTSEKENKTELRMENLYRGSAILNLRIL